MSLPAEMQWALLPPLIMTNSQVAVAGILEPAYDVAGDSFDYALNDDALHAAIIDAMGHGLDAAVMASVALAAYRHARRGDVELADLYAAMDRAIAGQFDEEHFVTVQMPTSTLAPVGCGWSTPAIPIRCYYAEAGWFGPWTAPPRCRSASAEPSHR